MPVWSRRLRHGHPPVEWGAVFNQAGGTLSGFNFGIDLRGTVGSVTNAGLILATGGGGGMNLYYGSVDNEAGGTIAGPIGIAGGAFGFHNPIGPITVTNAGTVSGADWGIYFTAGGTATNQSGGRIIGTSHAGVFITGGSGTVNNAGTIIGGTSGDAVEFFGNFTDGWSSIPVRFHGNVVGGSGSNTLELAQVAGAAARSAASDAIH